MKDSIELNFVYIASSLIMIIGLYYNIRMEYIVFPFVISSLSVCYNFTCETQGTGRSKLIKTISFISTYLVIITVFSWIFSVSSVDYFGVSLKDFIFNQEGYSKILFFTFYIIICFFILFILKYITDVIFHILKTIIVDFVPLVRKRVANFIAAYVFVSIVFAVLYNVIFVLNGKTFTISEMESPMLHDFLYFSVCTMATLGAPDIAPTGLLTKSLVIFQIFLNIFVLLIFLSYTFSDTKESDNRDKGTDSETHNG